METASRAHTQSGKEQAMQRWLAVVAVGMVLAPGGQAAEREPAPLFPFVLPWDDASPGITSLSSWLERPAGKQGPVRVGPDGHFHVGDQRIRFFGVNLCFQANFPRKQDAGKIAARMARFGINVVRFHHMDGQVYPEGIRARASKGTGELDPEALDRLDFLIGQLKEQGIYANLNLLVSRPFSQADGLPAAIESLDNKDRHVVGFFSKPIRKLQQEYARKLLHHRNPYTGHTYAEDPAVAFVEINNENGLLHAWLAGHVDRLPEVFRADLQRQWNGWLSHRHGTMQRLRQAWEVADEPLGAELLANGNLQQGAGSWVLERHEGAEATLKLSEEVPPRAQAAIKQSAQVTIEKPGTMGWHVQMGQSGLRIQDRQPFTLSFWAQADRSRTLRVLVGQNHDPWQSIGLNTEIKLSTAWKEVRLVFLASQTDANARVLFGGLGGQKGSVWLAGVSLRPGGVVGLEPGERLEDGSMRLGSHEHFKDRTAGGQRDWLRFLWETENDYWQSMQRYLKEELKVRAVIIGTIVGCSTPGLMAQLDAVDTHAYWQHPDFPGRPWDPENWVVRNQTMVNEVGGPLAGLALRRVVGKPHCVTEYNHPAPNTFGSEGFLLLAAYAALQDWDAIYAFAYSHRTDWDSRRIPSFFDIDQHPTRMVTLPPAVALFVRGDVKPARELLAASLSREQEVEGLRDGAPWQLVHAGHRGIPWEAALIHRIGLATTAGPSAPTRPELGPAPEQPRYVADTRELVWDLRRKGRGLVTVDTPRSKAVIGYGAGKTIDLGGVVIEPGQSRQQGWSAVTVTAMQGKIASGPARLLITATGDAENTNMRWKSPARDSVGRSWGEAPSLVEGIPARLTFPRPAQAVRAWSLDERGQRRNALRVKARSEKSAELEIGPEMRTLWYEVELRGEKEGDPRTDRTAR